MSAWTCLWLLCECKNVSRLLYQNAGKARLERKFHKWKLRALKGKSKPYGWFAQVYIFGCEWPSELQNSAVQIPGVMGYCGKYAQKWTRTLIMLSSPQEWICRHRKCVCKLFDTNSIKLTKTVISMSHREAIVRLTRKGWGGYIKTQSRYQWGWDGAIKTQLRYLGNQDPVKLLGQVLRSILWHVLNEFVLQDVHEEGLLWYLYHPRCGMICSSSDLWGEL